MIEDYYIDCVRRRAIETKNTSGRAVKTYVNTGIKGYLGSLSGNSNNQTRVTNKETIQAKYKFFCDDFELMFGDYVIYENVTYKVNGNTRNTTHKQHHVKTELIVVDNVT